MKRKAQFFAWAGIFFLVFLIPGLGRGYLLSPVYVLKKMVQNYRSLQTITVNQKVEVYGEDTTYPFAAAEEKAVLEPIVPMKIWVDGKALHAGVEIDPQLDINPFLIEAQRRYGFYKDVFLNHQVNLVTSLLGRLGIAPLEARLRLLNSDIAYQVGSNLTKENIKGIWVDKERFIPLRLAGTVAGQRDGKPFQEMVDIRYEDYRLISKRFWVPFDIMFFVDGKLSLRIRALSVSLATY